MHTKALGVIVACAAWLGCCSNDNNAQDSRCSPTGVGLLTGVGSLTVEFVHAQNYQDPVLRDGTYRCTRGVERDLSTGTQDISFFYKGGSAKSFGADGFSVQLTLNVDDQSTGAKVPVTNISYGLLSTPNSFHLIVDMVDQNSIEGRSYQTQVASTGTLTVVESGKNSGDKVRATFDQVSLLSCFCPRLFEFCPCPLTVSGTIEAVVP